MRVVLAIFFASVIAAAALWATAFHAEVGKTPLLSAQAPLTAH